MQESVIQWPLGLDGKDLVGAGISGIVARLDAVVKFCRPSELHFLEREKLIYQRLGRDHSGIVRYFGALENAIILQFASQTSIRQYLASQTKQVPLSLRLRWVEQLIDTIRFIHSRSVLHGDISCNNVFLDDDLNVKLGDFAGSAIDDLPPLICYETSHELPGEDISIKTDLFALGSTTYEIMTGSKPYKDLPDHEVSAAFAEGRYPDLESVSAFGNVVTKCWKQLCECGRSPYRREIGGRYHQKVAHAPGSDSSPPTTLVSFPPDCCFPDSNCRLGKALEITPMMHVSKVNDQCLP